ncbi:MAG: AAA family ATPase [Planctomycetota bacterium]
MSHSTSSAILASILADESFHPNEPPSLAEIGLPISLIEGLIVKRLAVIGQASGRQLAGDLCLPFGVLEEVYQTLRSQQVMVHRGSAPLNDYYYSLTEAGRERAAALLRSCAYTGPAPVPLLDYVMSVEAQTIRDERPRRNQLMKAFEDITIDEALFESLGPAVNSGAGLFLYGEPGNGKTTLAQRITQCFGQAIWIPWAIYEDGQIIKFYDAAYHRPYRNEEHVHDLSCDRRWQKVHRPTVVVGGEMTLDSLEIRFDPVSNTSEAPLQLKSNGGCLLVDDFGRQRVEPQELLNRWIIPLENRIDFLTLSTGKKIQIPFEQLLIFSTNLDPAVLADEAFLRRIPYKIEITDPSPEEFHELFARSCEKFDCEYRAEAVDYLLEKHYRQTQRRLRRCHPRDLLQQIRNYCAYNEFPLELKEAHLDRVAGTYFTAGQQSIRPSSGVSAGGSAVPAQPASQLT